MVSRDDERCQASMHLLWFVYIYGDDPAVVKISKVEDARPKQGTATIGGTWESHMWNK